MPLALDLCSSLYEGIFVFVLMCVAFLIIGLVYWKLVWRLPCYSTVLPTTDPYSSLQGDNICVTGMTPSSDCILGASPPVGEKRRLSFIRLVYWLLSWLCCSTTTVPTTDLYLSVKKVLCTVAVLLDWTSSTAWGPNMYPVRFSVDQRGADVLCGYA